MVGTVGAKEGEGGSVDKLRMKIKETTLFTDQAKIELLARLDEIPQAEQAVLVGIIDQFDQKRSAAGQRLRTNVAEELKELHNDVPPEDREDTDAAMAQIQLGTQILTG